MTVRKPVYEVSIVDDVGGRKGWHVLLKTTNKAEVDELLDMLKADEGVKAKFVILPAKR